MNMMVIVWVGLGLVIFALSFILPKRKEELDEDTKKFAGEQIRDILNKEIAGMQSKLDDVVSGTIEESSSQTERALEKLTNEKIMAINEYSDTVIEDINNNHKEVLFLYDMLNDKHVTIRNTVSEVEKTMGEVTQTAKDIEISAKEAAKGAKNSEEAVKRATDITNHAEKAAQRTAQNMEMDVRHIVEDMIRNRVEETMEKTAVPMIQEKVDEILEDAALFMEQQPKIVIDDKVVTESAADADSDKENLNESDEILSVKAVEDVHEESEEVSEVEFVQGITKNAPQIVIEGEDENNLSYYVVEPEKKENTDPVSKAEEQSEPKKISEIDMDPDAIRELEKAVALEVMQGAKKAEEPEKIKTDESRKVLKENMAEESRTEDVKPNTAEENRTEDVKLNPEENNVQNKPENKSIENEPKENFVKTEIASEWTQEDISAAKGQDNERRNNKEKILSLHKAGMSNVAIAKELGLGVGEVKLVIDLFKGM